MVANGSSSSTTKIRFCMDPPWPRTTASPLAPSRLRNRESECRAVLRLALDRRCRPPCCATIVLTIARPSPAPRSRSTRSSPLRKYASKMRSISSGTMPKPSSRTSISTSVGVFSRAESDAPSRCRELDRVVNQVHQHLPHQIAVDAGPRKIHRASSSTCIDVRRPAAQAAQRLVHQVGEPNRLESQFQPHRVARDFEHALDDANQARGFLIEDREEFPRLDEGRDRRGFRSAPRRMPSSPRRCRQLVRRDPEAAVLERDHGYAEPRPRREDVPARGGVGRRGVVVSACRGVTATPPWRAALAPSRTAFAPSRSPGALSAGAR